MLTGTIDLEHKRNFQGEILCERCGRPIGDDEKTVTIWNSDYHEGCADEINQEFEEVYNE